MKKMISMLLAGVLAAGTFATTAFAYTGDETSTVQETETKRGYHRPGYGCSAGWLRCES